MYFSVLGIGEAYYLCETPVNTLATWKAGNHIGLLTSKQELSEVWQNHLHQAETCFWDFSCSLCSQVLLCPLTWVLGSLTRIFHVLSCVPSSVPPEGSTTIEKVPGTIQISPVCHFKVNTVLTQGLFRILKIFQWRAGEMAQQLWVYTLAEDPSLVPSTKLVAHNCF